jgi:nitrogen fixation/metabolism regulation signal transduction histidine kinase
VRQALRYLLVVGGGIVSILLFLLATASDNTGFFDRYYSWLLGLNAAVAVSLLVMVGVSLARLYARYKAGKFGSRLMARLVLLFAGIGILPGLVIFLVSVQFVSHSIESWFNVRIEAALESGLNLGRAGLDEALAELNTSGRRAVQELAGQPPTAAKATLERLLQQQSGMQNVMIVSAAGHLIDSASSTPSVHLAADLPTAAMLAQARTGTGYALAEGGSDEHSDGKESGGGGPALEAALTPLDASISLRLRVLLPIPAEPGILAGGAAAGAGPPHFLQLLQTVPVGLASNAEVLRTAYSEYKERFVARVGLRKMYIETLTLTLLLAIFGAIASAFVIAGNLAQPLLVLAEGTRAVAEGDLSPRPIVSTNDELGTLTQSFNAMTRQLFEARSSVERNRSALQNAKAHLESVLGNMSAGVMVLDGDFRLVTCNASVERIMAHVGASMEGRPLAEIDGMQEFGLAVVSAFSAQSAQSASGRNAQRLHWQRQIEIPRRTSSADDHDITLLVRGSRLPLDSGSGYIVVFDDISDVISAQRSIAWGEVARRLAHEIKNPLTPIQLSAERMQMKLEDKLGGTDLELLNRSTTTIVNQVAAMKRMVDDFRDYARTPPAVLQPLSLNALVEEILHLYLGGDDGDIIHPQLAATLPAVMGDATQLRQVIHNLLQNAQDALAESQAAAGAAGPHPRIDVVTEAIHYRAADGAVNVAVRLAISDNGPGFTPKILSRAFEPYVTSKARGTGLGLAMVKKIVDEHGGRIDIHNQSDGKGASVVILLLKLAPVTTVA